MGLIEAKIWHFKISAKFLPIFFFSTAAFLSSSVDPPTQESNDNGLMNALNIVMWRTTFHLFPIILSVHIPQNGTLVSFRRMRADSVMCRKMYAGNEKQTIFARKHFIALVGVSQQL